MQSAPLVSVVLATYNWPSVLSYAIQTVLWQTFTDFELLIIGDCCTDHTEAIVRSFNDPRICWHNLPKNSGNQAGPNNAELELARGKYIAYMHQDDLWMPTHLDVLVKALEAENRPAAHTLCLLIGRVSFYSDERVRVIMGLPHTGYHLGPERRGIYAPALMHRTDAGRAISTVARSGKRPCRTIIFAKTGSKSRPSGFA